jgi:hypothetical protein
VELYDETPCKLSDERLVDLRLDPVLAQEPLVASCCFAAMDCRARIRSALIPPPSKHSRHTMTALAGG